MKVTKLEMYGKRFVKLHLTNVDFPVLVVVISLHEALFKFSQHCVGNNLMETTENQWFVSLEFRWGFSYFGPAGQVVDAVNQVERKRVDIRLPTKHLNDFIPNLEGNGTVNINSVIYDKLLMIFYQGLPIVQLPDVMSFCGWLTRPWEINPLNSWLKLFLPAFSLRKSWQKKLASQLSDVSSVFPIWFSI